MYNSEKLFLCQNRREKISKTEKSSKHLQTMIMIYCKCDSNAFQIMIIVSVIIISNAFQIMIIINFLWL